MKSIIVINLLDSEYLINVHQYLWRQSKLAYKELYQIAERCVEASSDTN